MTRSSNNPGIVTQKQEIFFSFFLLLFPWGFSIVNSSSIFWEPVLVRCPFDIMLEKVPFTLTEQQQRCGGGGQWRLMEKRKRGQARRNHLASQVSQGSAAFTQWSCWWNELCSRVRWNFVRLLTNIQGPPVSETQAPALVELFPMTIFHRNAFWFSFIYSRSSGKLVLIALWIVPFVYRMILFHVFFTCAMLTTIRSTHAPHISSECVF